MSWYSWPHFLLYRSCRPSGSPTTPGASAVWSVMRALMECPSPWTLKIRSTVSKTTTGEFHLLPGSFKITRVRDLNLSVFKKCWVEFLHDTCGKHMRSVVQDERRVGGKAAVQLEVWRLAGGHGFFRLNAAVTGPERTNTKLLASEWKIKVSCMCNYQQKHL